MQKVSENSEQFNENSEQFNENSEQFDEDSVINDFIDKLEIDALEARDKLIRVTQAVADIPWGEGRTIEDVFTLGVGTCTGKHKVLQACYDKLGVDYQPVVCTFRWKEQPIQYPQELKDMLAEGEWDHGHNFVRLADGTDVDITWDGKLAKYGFKTLPEDWDGKSSFIGVDNIIQRWDGVSIDEMKARLIGNLDIKTKERREAFLHAFIEWVASINK